VNAYERDLGRDVGFQARHDVPQIGGLTAALHDVREILGQRHAFKTEDSAQEAAAAQVPREFASVHQEMTNVTKPRADKR
jgi:hypothetical protein